MLLNLHTFSCAFCCCDKHYHQKQLVEERVYFLLALPGPSLREVMQELKGFLETGTTEDHFLLVCF